ncbi:cell shape-determining protein MreC [bacterium BMS3Bbin10]|nr:cell shape-determining protein MreC [bacterium BMS3Bbin10]
MLFALYFLSVMLLIFSRLENNQIREIRGLLTDLVSPVLQVASQPAIYARRGKGQLVDYLDLFDELDRLKEENQNLRHWQWQAQRLERRLAHFRELLNAVEEPALKYATGPIIADARGPFARSVLINLGKAHGVRNGYAVINGDGFVGRIVHTGDNASRAILLNDLNSRIPVLVGPAAVRAVLVGDNSAEPRLEFLPNSADVYEGDEVSTSGHGGVLPRGLRIGAVIPGSGSRYRVRPHAVLGELEYVSVLFFDTPVVVSRNTAAGARVGTIPPGGENHQANARGKRHARAGAQTR